MIDLTLLLNLISEFINKTKLERHREKNEDYRVDYGSLINIILVLLKIFNILININVISN